MTLDGGPSWSDIAGWYDELLTSGSGAHDTAVRCLLGLVPPLDNQVVLDVACGQGLATRALADVGARRVVGIDASMAMIERAKRHPIPAGADVSYAVDDAQQLATVDADTFDGVTCQLGLMDIPGLDATLDAIARVLKPRGWFAWVIGHPCFLVPDAHPTITPAGQPAVAVTGYFDERFWRSSNPHGVRRAGNHHRTLSTYLNAFSRAGFALERAEEPVASEMLASQQPLYLDVPIFFAACTRLVDIAPIP